MLIQTNKYLYNYYLAQFTAKYNKQTTYVERTEAFLAIQNNKKPYWIK